MNNTLDLFKERTDEIDFIFSVMQDIEEDNISTSDNSQLIRILKSNFLLMLYNLVEACVVSGMLEIYEELKNNEYTYDELIDAVQRIWSDHCIDEVYKSASSKAAYENRVADIIAQIITNKPIFLSKSALNISGNLDAKRIKDLCDKYQIRYSAKDKNGSLKFVKEKRQQLAHGEDSFGNCARDITLSQLKETRDAVVGFMNGILQGMTSYYNEKGYLKDPTAKKKRKKRG